MVGTKGQMLSCAAVIAIIATVAPMTAAAQGTGTETRISVSIPRQSLSNALRQLAEASGLQLIYDTRITDGRTAPAVSGTMTPRAALAALLEGSGLAFQFSGDRSAIISAPGGAAGAASEDGVRAVGVVNVEGVGNMPFGELASPVNGANGSRDVEATEGTGSYTTGAASIATKIPQPLKETPASVSVVTQQQIQDQGLASARDVLQALPGVTTTTGGNTEEFEIYSRGFPVTTFSFDGGAPFTYDYNNRPVIALSDYDSVQLVRGASGLTGGYGDPGGVVNLVRKKPLDHFQFTYDQDIGSWSNFREEADITGPLTKDRTLRARFVASRLDRNYFYDVAESSKTTVYGAIDYDLTPSTLLTLGASYIDEGNINNQGGLPRYFDGDAIDWPRSTCICVPFAFDRATKQEVFATVNQAIGKNWLAKLNLTYGKQEVDGLYYGGSSRIFRGGAAQSELIGFRSINPLKQLSVEFSANGKFTLFGREHTLLVGANYQRADNSSGRTYDYPTLTVPDIFNFNPDSYSEPAIPSAPSFEVVKGITNIYAIYGTLQLQLLKHLRASVGLRYNSYEQNATFRYSYSPDLEVFRPFRDRTFAQPVFSASYDLTNNLTIYASHQNIYKPQISTRYTMSDIVPPPIRGANDEAGLKWESPNKRLNATIAAYRVTQNGFLQTDYNNNGTSNRAYLIDIESQGIDVEVTGEIVRNLQISASYSYNDNKITDNSTPTSPRVQPQSSFTPKHTIKGWLIYRGEGEGPFGRITAGAGIYLQSKAFSAGTICVRTDTSTPPQCNLYDLFDFTTKGYTTFSLRLGYRLTRNLELSAQMENVTDVKTYASNPFQSTDAYNYYVEPRNILVSLRAKW